MQRNRTRSLFKHFLKNSPANQLSKYQEVFPGFQPDRKVAHTIPSDPAYLYSFLSSIETFGIPLSEIKLHRPMSLGDLSRIFAQNRNNYRPYRSPINESEQLQMCIREMSNLAKVNLSDYHEIEQRLIIATPETIKTVKTKLIYLFKLLLNRREKLGLETLEIEANIHLSETIVKVFSLHNEFGGNNREWTQLQAIEKLSRAREYKKNGYNQIATDSFAEIFKNQEAAYQTRLEALKNLCEEGEELGDTKVL